jgi:hypothetical protein
MGLIGAYLLYESGKAQSAKKQWVFLIAGFATIFIALVLGLNLVRLKS